MHKRPSGSPKHPENTPKKASEHQKLRGELSLTQLWVYFLGYFVVHSPFKRHRF